jgi:hypothetical protein
MNGYTIQKLADLPVILQTITTEWQFSRDMQPLIDATMKMLDEAQEPVYLVTDNTTVPSIDFNELVSAASQITRGGNPALHHPNAREFIVVTTNGLMKLATKGLNAPVFGSVTASAFDTVAEALAYVKQASTIKG